MGSYTKPPERNGKVADAEWRIAQAQERIAHQQERIAHQMAFIEWLGMTGRDTRHAITFLRTMEDTLAVMCRYRDLILLLVGTDADEPSNGEETRPLPYRASGDAASVAPLGPRQAPPRQG